MSSCSSFDAIPTTSSKIKSGSIPRDILIVLVHGTFQASFPDAQSVAKELAEEAIGAGLIPEVFEFRWGPGKKWLIFGNKNNSEQCRWQAARDLHSHLSELKAKEPDLKIMSVGHSHGGRVGMMVNCLGDFPLIDRVVGLSSPFFQDAFVGQSEMVGSQRVKVERNGPAAWKLGLCFLIWSLVSLVFELSFRITGRDPFEQIVLAVPGGQEVTRLYYAAYLLIHLGISLLLSWFVIRWIDWLISRHRICRIERVQDQQRGDAIALKGDNVLAFINHNDEVQYYLGFQEAMMKLVYSLTGFAWLIIATGVFLGLDFASHGMSVHVSGWVPHISGILQTALMMPDYQFLFTGTWFEDGAVPHRGVYLMQSVHLASLFSVCLEALRWILAYASTTQLGLGGPCSWLLAGQINLRRSPGRKFYGYENNRPLSTYSLSELKEIVQDGHGALLRDPESRKDWIRKSIASMTLNAGSRQESLTQEPDGQ